MSKTRFSQCIALACIATLAACTSGDGDTAGNTQLNVIVPDGGSDGTGTNGIDIGTVEYTISCDGNSDTFLDNNDSFPDEVVLNGNLEVVDGRTSGDPPVPTEIWEAFMDLPPGPCIIQLRARDLDGEVICVADDSFTITAGGNTKLNLVLVCNISFQAPVGMADVDATFSFVVGNFCPDLFVLNCVETNPQAPAPGIPPTTYCETRFRDGDSTCGNNCDPQSCDNTVIPPVCSPGPDPGVSTTVTCDANGIIDCEGDLTFDADCSWAGDTTGVVAAGIPVPVIFGGPGPAPGGFYAGCSPAAPPGAAVTCTALTTDGDVDCDKTKEVIFNCPGLNFCDVAVAGDNLRDCGDGNPCTDDSCDRANAQCVNTNSAAGTACLDAGGFGGTCDGAGLCVSTDCNAQPNPDDFCNDGNVCTAAGSAGSCQADGSCDTSAVNEGGACDSGTGSGVGQCNAGTCDSLDTCTDAASCDDGNDCTADVCSGAPLACSYSDEPAGTSCDPGTGNPGSCDGAGACVEQAPLFVAAGSGSTTWFAPTTPPGGGTAPTTGGCSVFVTVLNTTIFLDVFITLDVVSDGANNITTGWALSAQNPLLGALGGAAELGDLAISALVTGDATGGPYASGLDPSVVGLFVGEFYAIPNVAGPLELFSPTEITPGGGTITPTALGTDNVNINWDGTFSLRLDLAGNPLVVVDESVCAFSGPGAGVDFSVVN